MIKSRARHNRILDDLFVAQSKAFFAALKPSPRFVGELVTSPKAVGLVVCADIATDAEGLIHLRAVDAVGDALLTFAKGQRVRVLGKREGARGLLLEHVRETAL